MRDLINQITFLLEDRTLSAGVIKKYPERFDDFISMIRSEIPFYTVDKEPVTADPSEADRFQEMFDNDTLNGAISMQLVDGTTIPLSKLLKTSDLGGQASTGQEGEETGKEAALLKPSQIGICDRYIPATELGDEIVNNQILQSTDYGRIVIGMAEEIMGGANPVIPKEVPTKIKDSIIDYAGEYLGVLALVSGTSRFPRKKGFTEWLGADINELVLNFPAKANTNIADSYATISNEKTKHTINISSKGKGGGAPPSISGLKIPQEIRDNPDYEATVAFIDLCDAEGGGRYNLPSPKTISQVFQAMNLFYQYVPEAIPEKFNEFLPWPSDIVTQVTDSMNAFKKKKNLPLPEYKDLWSDIAFKKPSSDGGKLTHAVKLAVMQAVNEGRALPEFADVILAVLDMNFVQQYADFDPKSRVMSFATQWPAKLEGNISLESKSGATDPTKGGFSFKLSPTEPKTNLAEPNELGVEEPDQTTVSKKDFAKNAEKIALGHREKPKNGLASKSTMGDVGRKLRKV
jgi:hypothetical protein